MAQLVTLTMASQAVLDFRIGNRVAADVVGAVDSKGLSKLVVLGIRRARCARSILAVQTANRKRRSERDQRILFEAT
jgi:hypothetical protein